MSTLAKAAVPMKRSRAAEQALARVSRLLVSSAGRDLDQILLLIGTSFGAEHVYVAFATEAFVSDAPTLAESLTRDLPPPVPSHWLGTSRAWSREGAPPLDTDLQDAVEVQARQAVAQHESASRPFCVVGPSEPSRAFALPLLSDDDRFVGYLGFVMPPGGPSLSGALGRALSVLGDILGAHLSRLAADEARANTERRWRTLVDHHPDSTLVTVDGWIVYANTAAVGLFAADDAEALRSLSFRDFLSAAEEDRILAAQRAQLASDAPYPVEHTILRLDGDERWVESVSVPFSGLSGGVQTVLRDVTERVLSERRYQTFVETISEGVWRVDLTRPVAPSAPPHVQAEQIVAAGRLSEINPVMRRLFWPDRSPLGASVRALAGDVGRMLFQALAEAGHRLHDYEVVVHRPGQPPRYLSVNAVSQFDRGLLVSVWGSCTDVTERVAMERAMVDALEEQQERIGRDLHDSVGQLLTGVRMMSENVASQVAGHPAEATALRVAAYASEALDQVRTICRGLVPPHLYSEGVAIALADLVEQANALGPARCVFRRTGRVDLAEPDVALQCYRIAQEAISNALRHAHASRVSVVFGPARGGVVMEVRDDGVGFELDRERSRSIGLLSMRRRAHLVGATLTIETAPGGGTRVRLMVRPNRDRTGSEAERADVAPAVVR